MKIVTDRSFQATRRTFLKGGAAMGLAGALPLLMSACSDDDDDAPPQPREARHLNFDLSSAAVVEPRLVLPRSSSHGARLQAHTAASRQKHRQLNPLLGAVADDDLTHYFEDVDLPANALQIVGVMGKDPVTGRTVLVGHHVHAPTSSLLKAAERRAALPAASRLTGKLESYGVRAGLLDTAPVQSQIDFNSPPWDVATWLVFQHPQITNLDPDLGTEILARIQDLPCDPTDDTCTPYLGTLAFSVAQKIQAGGYPTTVPTGSWAVLVPTVDEDTGQPVLDENGAQIYSYTISPDLSDPLAAVVKAVLNDINDDPMFAGSNWQPADGGPTLQTPQVGALPAAAATSFGVRSGIALGSRASGIRMAALAATDDRAVALTVRNEFIRSASAYVEYRDASGTTLAVANKGGLDSDRAKFLTIVGPDAQIMGVPFQGSAAPATRLQFTLPPEASQAVVYFGGLGLGGSDAFSPEALPGSIATLVLNIGLPTVFLTLGINATFSQGIRKAFEDALEDPITMKTILDAVVKSVASGALRGGIQSSIGSMSIKPFLIGISSFVVQTFLKICPRIAAKLAEAAAASAAVDAIPFVGGALYVLSVAADVATIAETVIECVTCPAIDRNAITLTMTSTVRVSRDPNDFQFPATARKASIQAFYDGGRTPVAGDHDVVIAQGQTEPIDLTLSNVPSGGKVVVKVSLYSDQGCLVGSGISASLVNLPATAALIPITIKEVLVPLNATTTYRHSLKLGYAAGAHAWTATSAAPMATRKDLCQGNDGKVCSLTGITVHTPSGMAGYGYFAGGQGSTLCGGGTAASQYMVRNIFLGQAAESGAKVSSCGFTQPIAIVYDPLGPAVGGHHFILEPEVGGSYFQLRGVTLDTTTPFDLFQTTSWGRFMNAMESLTVTTSGHVVGVNRVTHKMEVLLLPTAAVDPVDAPDSVPFSALKGGKGTRAGLLDTPVAVTSRGGTIFVLEQGNLRIQAFNPDGTNPVPAPFVGSDGQPTPLLPLHAETGGATATCLDIAVEGEGYLYVLSYTGDGTSPSDYHLDLYSPTGTFLSRTGGVTAGAIAVDLFRNLYTLNYESLATAPQVQPSLSQWIPFSGSGCGTTTAAAPGVAGQALASCAVPAGAV